MVILLLGCADPADPVSPDAADPLVVLRRLSLDVRGVRPSVDELRAVAADPGALDGLRAEFLADPRFGERVVSSFAEIWNTVQDEAEYPAETFGLDDEPAFARAVGEEPLRILAEVATADLPWTTIVTADWTRVDANLAAAWPVTAAGAPGTDGWWRATYTDARPAAGALATNGLWWRYETSSNNASRGRANQVSRILLCRDYLDQPVEFDRSLDLADPEVVDAAMRSNPGCVSCHHSLDPLASLLGGVYFSRKSGVDEMLRYHPERETLWRSQTGVAPAYFGLPAETLGDLGQRIAADPAFVDCAVSQSAELLLRRPLGLDDTADRTAWREAFLAGGLTLRSLWGAIVSSPAYGEGEKLVSPDQMASQIADLTGFRFLVDGADLLRTSDAGLASLAGGPDGRYAVGVTQEWSATLVLVQRRVAEAAADHAVRVEPDRLIPVDPAAALDDAALRDALAEVHLRVLSRAADEAGIDALAAHHAATGGGEAGWTSVLTVLLRDPMLVMY